MRNNTDKSEGYCFNHSVYHSEDENTAKQLKRMNKLYDLSAEGDNSNEKELVNLERIFYPGEPDLYTSK